MLSTTHRPFRSTVVAALAAMLLATALVGSASAAPSPTPRIIGGEPADLGEYPFMVGLLYEPIDGTDYQKQFCGASLISSRYVLTAAHCVDWLTAAELAVVVNRTNLDSTEGVRVAVRSIHIHPAWNPNTFENDVAVLRLAKPVSGVEPIDLADAADDVYETPGTLLTVIGWGNTSTTGQASFPDGLQELQVPVVSDADCDFAYGGGVTVESQLCAGERGVDSCQGDSGGPLFATTTSGDFVQVGIVSYGFKCAKQRYPGVYTEINSPSIRTFIASVAGV